MKRVTAILVVCILLIVSILYSVFFSSTFNRKVTDNSFKGTVRTTKWSQAADTSNARNSSSTHIDNTVTKPRSQAPGTSNARNSSSTHIDNTVTKPRSQAADTSNVRNGSSTHKENTKPKTILFWTSYYGMARWNIKSGKEVCGPYTCILSYDKKQYSTASALMFHHRTDWLLRLPTDRPRIPWQRWVLYNRESSWWGPKGEALRKADNLFNWTMGFRHDNDITIPTAVTIKRPFKGGFDPNKNYMEGKTGEIVDLMSACIYYPHPGYESRRKYIEFVQKNGLNFDMYGKCGKSCAGSCSKVLEKYKFVIAFENSLCDEYISEKPYVNGFMLGVVPIIMSGANLSDPNVLPPGSYIDGKQFTSVSALAAFVKKVGSDPTLYNKYFEWRKDWDFEIISEKEGQKEFPMNYFCPLCTKLHEDSTPKFIGNVQEWYEQQKCKEYPKMNP